MKLSQRDRVLKALRSARSRGVTNVALNRICFRYGGRIFELRRAGWKIQTVYVKPGLFRFVLDPVDWL